MDLVQIKVLFESFLQDFEIRFENHVSVMGTSPLS